MSTLHAVYAEHVAWLEAQYAATLARHGFDAVVIHSGSLFKRSEYDDQYWPLRATPHFQHWLPLAQPDCALVVRPGKKPLLYWTKPASFWENPAPPETDHFTGSFEIVFVESPEQMRLPSGQKIADVGKGRDPEALVRDLDQLRTKKTAYEVHCLEEANRRAARGHDAVRALFFGGDASELELHLAFLRATSQDDPETPYKNIVALGPHAATLHHVSYDKTSHGAQSLLLDAGATYQGYCSDITRTWVKGGGEAASAFGELVLGVEAMQQRLCKQVALGMKYEALHDDAHRQVGDILRETGLVTASTEQAMSSGITRAFFPHGLGHSLGLQCHDVGCALVKPRADNPFLRNTSTIEEKQVFTIEPGIYFIEGLMEKLRGEAAGKMVDWKLAGEMARLGGVRIEDDVVVTGGAGVSRNITREFLPVGGGKGS